MSKDSTKEERVIVISPQKSGTHLIQELMVHLGYGMSGDSRIPPEIQPKLMAEDRAVLRRFALSEEEQAYRERSSAHMREALDWEAWLRVARSWQMRLGAPVENRYGTEVAQDMESAYQSTELMRMRFSETPRNICWIYHQFDVNAIDGLFLREWCDTQRPKIILNIRDPRDVMVSFVNYLCGNTGRGFGNFAVYQVMSRTLSQLDSFEDRLTYALEDSSFPGHGDLRSLYWLFKHPHVCTVRFEELIGPKGGASRAQQLGAIQRILMHLNVSDDPEELAEKVYNPNAFTFHEGKTGSWRKYYTARQLDLCEKRFGEVLDLYGYREGKEGWYGYSVNGAVNERAALGSTNAGRAGIAATQ